MDLCFGQRIDESTGLIQPWITHGSLDAIAEMDWSDKIVWQFGSGLGDAWIARRCKKLYCVERNREWLYKASQHSMINGADNIEYLFRPCNEGSGMAEMYCEITCNPDVIIIDDAYRYECIVKALEMPRPLTLIVDNWFQAFVFICPAAVELLKDIKQEIYEQSDHQDHDGVNKWKTGIFHLT